MTFSIVNRCDEKPCKKLSYFYEGENRDADVEGEVAADAGEEGEEVELRVLVDRLHRHRAEEHVQLMKKRKQLFQTS